MDVKHLKNSVIIPNYFLFAFPMPPSRGDKVILENGTAKADKVGMRDLKFWLPHTKGHLCDM